MPKIAVVLSGCGVYDGSEIHETAAAMAALTRGGAEVFLLSNKISRQNEYDMHAACSATSVTKSLWENSRILVI